jgi:hypothetical protein
LSFASFIQTMESYTYIDLTDSQQEIRLAELQPGRFGDALNVQLQHQSLLLQRPLLERPVYTALSYVWGDPKDQRPISLDRRSSSITANLFDALQHIRDETEAITLWIDAICINQTNYEELGEQVRMMGSIFSSAQSVIAWIGPPDKESDIAMDFMLKISRLITDVPDSDVMAFLAVAEQSTAPLRKALQRIFRRSYWERVWIIQELASAREVQVRCGHYSAPVEAFQDLVTALNSNMNAIASYVSISKASRLLKLAQLYHGQAPQDQRLIDMLWSTVGFQATDPRDRIYALLGIAREQDRVAMVPDYTRTNSFTILLRRLVKHHITAEKNLDILCYFPTLDSKTSGAEGSWLPNLSQHLNGISPQSFAAAGNKTSAINVSQDLTTLSADGVIFDHVETVIGPFGLSVFSQVSEHQRVFSVTTDNSAYKDMQKAARLALRHRYPNFTSEELDDICWDKLLGDKIYLGQDKPDSPCPCGYLELWEALIPTDDNSLGLRCCEEIVSGTSDSSGRLHCRYSSAVEQSSRVLDLGSSQNLANFTRLANRSFFVTTKGMIGLGPPRLEKNDTVSILFGCNLPVVLRRAENRQFEWVGPAYVYGMMDGEAINGVEEGSSSIRSFIIR